MRVGYIHERVLSNRVESSSGLDQDMSYEYLCDDTRATEVNIGYPISMPFNSNVTNESINIRGIRHPDVVVIGAGRTILGTAGNCIHL